MASGTIYGTTGCKYIDAKIDWESSKDSAISSEITASLYFRVTTPVFTGIKGYGSIEIDIDGQKMRSSPLIEIPWMKNDGSINYNVWVLAKKVSASVPHNRDGTKTASITCTGSVIDTDITAINVSGQAVLDRIAFESPIDYAKDVNLTAACEVAWSAFDAMYCYKLKFGIGEWIGETDIICPGAPYQFVYTGYTFPLEVAHQITDSKTGIMTATLYTYTDSTAEEQVGNPTTATFIVTVPDTDETKPSVAMELAPITNSEKFASLYIRGQSRIKATLEGAGKYGSPIVNYAVKSDDSAFVSGANPFTTSILSTSGEISVIGTAIDGRGHAGKTETTITVLPYDPPYISPTGGNASIICARCTEKGELSDSGTYLRLVGARTFTELTAGENANTCAVRLRYKSESGEWSHEAGGGIDILLSNDTSDSFDVVLAGIVTDTMQAYSIEINLTDDVSPATAVVFKVQSETVCLHLRKGGRGVGVGKYAIDEDVFDCDFIARFNKDVEIGGAVVTDTVIDEGETNGWRYRKWLSGGLECWRDRPISVTFAPGSEVLMFYTASVAAEEYPIVFAETPVCHVSVGYDTDSVYCLFMSHGHGTKAETPAVNLYGAETGTEIPCTIHYSAIGRWK